MLIQGVPYLAQSILSPRRELASSWLLLPSSPRQPSSPDLVQKASLQLSPELLYLCRLGPSLRPSRSFLTNLLEVALR